ncbi:hypothetical protein P7C70_g4578, partial [Phenoliferia sp. Uapishka_3]
MSEKGSSQAEVVRRDGKANFNGNAFPPLATEIIKIRRADPAWVEPDLLHRTISQRLVGNIWIVCSFCCLGGILFGFDIASMSAVLALDSYNNYFGKPDSSLQGGISSSISAGSFAGSILFMFTGDRLGRRGTVFLFSPNEADSYVLDSQWHQCSHVLHCLHLSVCRFDREEHEPDCFGYSIRLLRFASSIHFYFMFPETRGRPLEEMNVLFESGIPAWKTKNLPIALQMEVEALAEAQRRDIQQQMMEAETKKEAPTHFGFATLDFQVEQSSRILFKASYTVSPSPLAQIAQKRHPAYLALVTGGSRGIGLAIALRLAKDGYDIAINDVESNLPGIEAAVERIVGLGRKAVGVVADVTDDEAVEAMVQEVVNKLGRLECITANAGICQVKPLLERTAADRKKCMDVNVLGLMNMFVSAARQMVKQGNGGRIIGACGLHSFLDHFFTIKLTLACVRASIAAYSTAASMAAYGASKFAVHGFCQAAAKEWGKHGIRVNSYAPGIIDTAMWSDIDQSFGKELGQKPGEHLSSQAANIILGRVGTPDDVA